MAVYFVTPTAPAEESAPADGDDYTYARTPAPARTAARIANLERRIANLENEQQIQAAEHGEQLADLAARLDRLEEPSRRTRQIMAALFGDGRIEA